MNKKDQARMNEKWDAWWSRMTERFHTPDEIEKQLADADKLMQKIIATVQKESKDVVNAFWLAVVVGDQAREEALSQGGDPEPERVAFELGIVCRGLFRNWVIKQLGSINLGDIFNPVVAKKSKKKKAEVAKKDVETESKSG